MLARIALIDADTLIYAAALNSEKAVEWHDGLWTLHSDFNEAKDRFERMVEDIEDALEPDKLIMTLSDSTPEARWRMAVMPTYKQNRKKTRRPLVFTALREYVHETYDTFEREGLEGDDILGILATRDTNRESEDRIIVSIDKDLKTIPGKLYNYGKPELDVVNISEDEADYWHLYQTLTGDATDGYPGCPGCGPVSAKKILDPFWFEADGERLFDSTKAWDAVERAYRKAGLAEDVALMNAQVARILRAADFDFQKKKPILWNP
jgi:DNA polymerase-1